MPPPQSLLPLWKAARISAQVRPVPDLLPAAGARGRSARRHEGELVGRGNTMTDPIADMLTRVRNAINARHPKVDVPASKLKTEIARILKDEGYIINYKLTEE